MALKQYEELSIDYPRFYAPFCLSHILVYLFYLYPSLCPG